MDVILVYIFSFAFSNTNHIFIYPLQPKHTQLKRIWSTLSGGAGSASKNISKRSKTRITLWQTLQNNIQTVPAVLDFYVVIFLKIIFPDSVFGLVTNHCYMHMPTVTTLQICWHNPISFHHYFPQYPFIIASSKPLINMAYNCESKTPRRNTRNWQNRHSQGKITSTVTFNSRSCWGCTKFLSQSCETRVSFNTKKLQRNMKPIFYRVLSFMFISLNKTIISKSRAWERPTGVLLHLDYYFRGSQAFDKPY